MGVTIWSGLVQGAIYALVATGFIVTLIPSGVFNFAQGALVVGGTFLTYHWLQTVGVGWFPALLLNAVAGILIGSFCELVTVRPLRWGRRIEGGPAELVTTVGMATALTGIYGLVWGYLPLAVPFSGPTGTVTILGVNVTPVQIVVVGGAIVVSVALFVWLRLTMLGQACLAVSENRDAAMLRGINVNLLSIGAFAAAGCLAGLSAMAIGPITYALPTLGNSLALGGFVALVIGGETSFIGGLIGGFLTGLVFAFATRYLGASYASLSVLALLLLTLAVRPHGLGGAGETRIV